MFVSLAGDGIVYCDGRRHPEPLVGAGEVAPSWATCTIPGCRHDPCPAKLRAWGFVKTRREGQQVHYAVASTDVRKVLQTLYGIYCA